MEIPSLTHLSNAELGETLKHLRNREREAIAEIVLHLSEVDSRGMYRDLGYSSLFSYCRECLGYSEGGAYRRIQAARCLKTKQSSSTNSRHIPLVTRDQIFIQNEGRCSYISSTGVRCSSTRCLQIDHIHPLAKGGSSVPSNLRLLCPEHNRHAAELLL